MKRILSLDGGGIRGMFSIQILLRVEALLREHHGDPNLVLADVFDCFAGTSTGAIIASCLCWGMTVSEIEELYLKHGPEMFARSPWYRRFHSKYRADSISKLFQRYFREDDSSRSLPVFGTSKLRKMLIVVMRNASTGSPWPLSNHPEAKYNSPELADCNLDIPFWQILRASTAAPSFFPPQEIRMNGKSQLFVDGAITPYNNPALLAALMTTLPGFGVHWKTGREHLHLVSIGTGSVRAKLASKASEKVHLFDQLGHVIPALIGAVSLEQDMLCRVLGDCLFGDTIDSEIGKIDLPTLLSAASQLFSYVRYDQRLDQLRARQLTRAQTQIDNITMLPTLQEIGRQYAEQNVRLAHLFPR